jgi:tetratricopeptide (TPR) repeat protein
MRARNTAVFTVFAIAVAAFTALSVLSSPPLSAQQTGNAEGAAASAGMPADLQTKLAGLHAELKSAQDAQDAKAEAAALNKIGALYYGVSDYMKALDSYNQALTVATSAANVQEEAAALNGIGSCYLNQAQNQKAIDVLQRALDLATPSGDEQAPATALSGIGFAYIHMGQAQKALDF